VLRRIPLEVPGTESLGLPVAVRELAELPRGLVLITGPTGSGKSTTLAALIHHLNQTRELHVITVEDPVEYLHQDQRCFITQREVGTDAASFTECIHRSLRQDPDVIALGEMRDRESIAMALQAAETGHLVFGTMHTTGAVQTVDRVLDAFPGEARSQARNQLSQCLAGVVSQTLVPRRTGGRVAAFEVMMVNEAIQNCIREGKTHQLQSLIQTGSQHGMQTLNLALAELVRGGEVSEDAARVHASRNSDFDMALQSGRSPLRVRRRETIEPPVAPSPATPPVPSADEAPGTPSADGILERLRRS
jgi:twitching motility protein PilT